MTLRVAGVHRQCLSPRTELFDFDGFGVLGGIGFREHVRGAGFEPDVLAVVAARDW